MTQMSGNAGPASASIPQELASKRRAHELFPRRPSHGRTATFTQRDVRNDDAGHRLQGSEQYVGKYAFTYTTPCADSFADFFGVFRDRFAFPFDFLAVFFRLSAQYAFMRAACALRWAAVRRLRFFSRAWPPVIVDARAPTAFVRPRISSSILCFCAWRPSRASSRNPF